jgi:hypothetical protein
MLSHGIINASHVTGLLSLLDGVTGAIDGQVARNKGDLEQESSSFPAMGKVRVNFLTLSELALFSELKLNLT